MGIRKTPSQKHSDSEFCAIDMLCVIEDKFKEQAFEKITFFDIKLPKVTFSTTKSYILRFRRQKYDMFSLNIKAYFGLMMIIFLAVSTGGCAKHNMEAYSQLSEAGGNMVEDNISEEIVTHIYSNR